MTEWAKTLVASGVIAGIVSWLAASHKIEQELHSRQGEAGYEALIEANSLLWRSEMLTEEAQREMDKALAAKAQALKRESDASYITARLRIAAFGDERVVKALSTYYFRFMNSSTPCRDKEKFRSDTQTYKAIRNTLGVGGSVSDEQLANIVFLCSLER